MYTVVFEAVDYDCCDLTVFRFRFQSEMMAFACYRNIRYSGTYVDENSFLWRVLPNTVKIYNSEGMEI